MSLQTCSRLFLCVIAACCVCIVWLWMSRDYRITWRDRFNNRSWPPLNKEALMRPEPGGDCPRESEHGRENRKETRGRLWCSLSLTFIISPSPFFLFSPSLRSGKTCRMPGSVPVPATSPPSLTSSRSAPQKYYLFIDTPRWCLSWFWRSNHLYVSIQILHLCRSSSTTRVKHKWGEQRRRETFSFWNK